MEKSPPSGKKKKKHGRSQTVPPLTTVPWWIRPHSRKPHNWDKWDDWMTDFVARIPSIAGIRRILAILQQGFTKPGSYHIVTSITECQHIVLMSS